MSKMKLITIQNDLLPNSCHGVSLAPWNNGWGSTVCPLGSNETIWPLECWKTPNIPCRKEEDECLSKSADYLAARVRIGTLSKASNCVSSWTGSCVGMSHSFCPCTTRVLVPAPKKMKRASLSKPDPWSKIGGSPSKNNDSKSQSTIILSNIKIQNPVFTVTSL